MKCHMRLLKIIHVIEKHCSLHLKSTGSLFKSKGQN